MARTSRRGLRWTPEEDNRLIAMLEEHRGYAEIARALGRPIQGVMGRAGKHLGVTLRSAGGRTQSEVATLLGVCHQSVMRWRRRGWLRCRSVGHTVFVDEDALFAFMEDPRGWAEWEVDRVTDPTIREWAREIRSGSVRYLTTDEAAARLCVVRQAIAQAVRQGRLGAVKAGKRLLVREDQLHALTAGRRYVREPVPRYRALQPDVLEVIEREWGRRPGSEIARELGISTERVGSVAREVLGLPALGRGYWRRRRREL